ncbi:MAG: adenylate/guanylate cyclase domain-containing protein [Spirochaetes bacterium]|nr:adenylate/guanylate cyclase domain-containing protein [Spirochaetota bacterium]
MRKLLETVIGKKINKTRVFPVTTKIVIIFTLIILISNFTSNYINLIYNRTEQLNLLKQLLAKDLTDFYGFANTQYEIYQFNRDLKGSFESIQSKGNHLLKRDKAIALCVKPDGTVAIQSSNKVPPVTVFQDRKTLNMMIQQNNAGAAEGFIDFTFNNERYIGIYKYNPKWEMFLIRAEEENEFYQSTRTIFRDISIIIIFLTIVSAVVGIGFLKYILRFINIITSNIMKMVQNQQLELIDLKGAPNDDITYLGVAFNSLSSTINNLVNIFRKFANKDIAIKAYRERQVMLEGAPKELTVLFSDIKSFTFITETLGHDIIKLLNLHYDRAIREIVKYDGVIGSIIGDALLAVFGVFEESSANKSLQAVLSAYKIHEVAESLRQKMELRKERIIQERGCLLPEEERVYKAVLLEVGVGIDGGEVFWGTIGSYVRMTSTVIGDNVNSASRLEGLTRIYHVPVICSEYVKNDIEQNVPNHEITFVEIDTVLVKGKTEGKKIFWPILNSQAPKKVKADLESFSQGLDLYYRGEWKKAYRFFAKCKLPMAEVFKDRTKNYEPPKKWNGIWEMKTK